MDYKFNYSLDKNDLINFELFKLKSSKFMSMIYITVLIMLVMNTYYAFSEKNYAYLLIPALYIVAIGIYLFYVKKIRPDIRVKRCIKADVYRFLPLFDSRRNNRNKGIYLFYCDNGYKHCAKINYSARNKRKCIKNY